MKTLTTLVAAVVLSSVLISVPTLANSDQEPSTSSNGESVSEVVERDVPQQ